MNFISLKLLFKTKQTSECQKNNMSKVTRQTPNWGKNEYKRQEFTLDNIHTKIPQITTEKVNLSNRKKNRDHEEEIFLKEKKMANKHINNKRCEKGQGCIHKDKDVVLTRPFGASNCN